MPSMKHELWKVCLIKSGTAVLVNLNYNVSSTGAAWHLATLLGVIPGNARQCRVLLDARLAHADMTTEERTRVCTANRVFPAYH